MMKGTVYIETYGCQMNVGDTEIVAAILGRNGWTVVDALAGADVALVNTCAIREGAEQKVLGRLSEWRAEKRKRSGSLTVGVIGCMAERMQAKLLEQGLADLVAGPDAYRRLPNLLEQATAGHKAIDVALSTVETYEDIAPVRLESNGVSAFVSIMRGCNNFCAYCVVPYTRGRERSRPVATILGEVCDLFDKGYKEVTLLGQNVNSYQDHEVGFAQLLAQVAQVSPQLRVRFATSHPKDFSHEVIATIAAYPNIARSIHLPAQSGSSAVLERMKRRYTREWYLDRIAAIRRAMPDCAISTDLISGFCGETDDDHAQTLSLMREVGYDFAYMFAYSERPGTFAHGNMKDDIAKKVKNSRLAEVIELQNELSLQSNRRDVGQVFEVLIEGRSKRSDERLFGRTSQGKVAVFDRVEGIEPGDYVWLEISTASSATLQGKISLKLLRSYTLKWAKANLLNQQVRHKILGLIVFTVTGLKESLNQPHQFFVAKIKAVEHIVRLIEEGTYMGFDRDKKGQNKTLGFHYLEAVINNHKSYIVIKENLEGVKSFYSIVDRIKKPEPYSPKDMQSN